MKILIAGFQHETNSFVANPTGFEDFVHGGMFPALIRGSDVFDFDGVNIAIGGFLSAARGRKAQLIPALWAGATPSGAVTAEAFERIAGEICSLAEQARPDAIYLDLHGAMLCEHVEDGEGELLARLRRIVGPRCPIVASLDLHANVTARMMNAADGLVAYRTYPHIDMAETGDRAAALLFHLLDSGTRLHKAFRRLPFLIPVTAMATEVDPARSIYRALGVLEQSGTCPVWASFAPGFPAADFAECGGSAWAYAADPAHAERVVEQLWEQIVLREPEWRLDLVLPDEAVHLARQAGERDLRPVIIADVQDNPGAGGSSDSTGLLKALLAAGAQDAALGLIVDPAAAAAAHAAGIGADLTLALGGRSGAVGDSPLTGAFRVKHLSDGRCRFDGPMMHGKNADVGPSACLLVNGLDIAVSSRIDQMLDRALFRMAGVEPEAKRIVVVKSAVHFRADFAPIAGGIILARAPGPVAADPAELPWRRLAPGMRLTPLGPRFDPADSLNQEGPT